MKQILKLCVQRHYTLNIDGLAELVGLTTWHPVANPTGMLLCFFLGVRIMNYIFREWGWQELIRFLSAEHLLCGA